MNGDHYRQTHQSKCRLTESTHNEYIYITLLYLRVREYCGKKDGKFFLRIRGLGSWLWVVFPSNARSYTHKVSPPRLSNHEMNKGNSNRDAKLGRGKPMRSQCMWNIMALREAKSGRNSLAWGRVHWLAVQSQMLSPEDIHTSNTIQTVLVIYIYQYTYISITIYASNN